MINQKASIADFFSRKSAFLFKLFLVFFLFPTISAATPSNSPWLEAVADLKLDQNPQWLSLLHFQGGNSTVTSDSFFLSEQGRYAPKQELIATIQSLHLPASHFPVDQHPQCRFPARTLWLETMLGDKVSFPLIHCPRLENWRINNPVDSVSFIFVSGYLSNPASFFGHVLLKLNEPNKLRKNKSPLLDLSVNYGASVGRGDGPLKYVTYGLLGGYNAEYTMDDFFVYDSAYAELENRVMWEYELNLKPFDVELIETHLWELKKQTFDYYFLTRNCATQLANLVAMVTKVSLLTENQPWDMPIDVFKNMVDKTYNGKPLVKQVIKRESKYTRLHNKYLHLTAVEREAAKQLSKSRSYFSSPDYQGLNARSKARVLSLLYDFYEIKIQEQDKEDLYYQEIKHQLLVENLKLPGFELDWPMKQAQPPHKAQNPKKLGVQYGYNSGLGSFSQLDFRIGYYDYLALEASRYTDSNATFLETELRQYHNKTVLNKLDFFNISTLNILDVDLFDSRQYAWKMALSLEQENLSCNDCLRSRFYGGLGLAQRELDTISLYAMPEAMLDLGAPKKSTLGVEFGLLYTTNPLWKTRLSITPLVLKEANNPSDIKVLWESRFGDSSRWDVRFKLRYDVETESSIAYAWYF